MISVRGYHLPSTLDEAIDLRGHLGGDATVVAGATDVGVQVRRGVRNPTCIIDIHRVAELGIIAESGGSIRLGAAVTHRTVERSPWFSEDRLALAEACSTIGGVQTRAVGTVGGNLCNASPAADAAPPLVSMDAEVELHGPAGPRRIPLHEFLVGYRQTTLADDELLTSIHLPPLPSTTGTAFEKLGRRRAMEISIVSVAARVSLTEDGAVAGVGVALGSVAPTCIRAPGVEQALVGSRPTADAVRAASRQVLDHLEPIDDLRASAAYRRRVAPVLTERAMVRAVERASAHLREASG
jgi:aerobic carbon-monoxide dehydrogenase medium subunit